MDFSKIPIFNVMKARLSYDSARQQVLAQNVANADTPNYKAKDIAAPDFKSMMGNASQNSTTGGKLTMTVTDSKHLMGIVDSLGAFKVDKRPTTDELNPDGNNVAIEDEMMKVAQNQMDYTKTLNLYHKMISLFTTAVGGQSSGG